MSMTLKAYEYWVGMDEWTRVQASLLLVEIDPTEITQFVIKELDVYFESETPVKWRDINGLNDLKIQEAWRIYQRFRRVEFGVRYSDDPYFNWGAFMYRQAYHPYLFMREALIRNIPIPANLMRVIDDRYLREHEKKFFESNSSRADSKLVLKQKSGRSLEYDNIGKGLMAMLLAEQSGLFTFGNNINASQIKNAVLGLAKKYGIDEFGLGTLERDITAGLEQLERKYNLFSDKKTSKA